MATNDASRDTAMKKAFYALIAIAVCSFVAVSLYKSYTTAQQKEPLRTMQATDFELQTLDGDTMSLHDQRGKVVILNFWASWCEPCRYEMPHFQSFYERYQQEVEIIAVNVTSKDHIADVEAFRDTYRLTFPILLDETGDISTMYGAFSIPTTVILDRDGQVVHEVVGPMEEAMLSEVIEPLL